MFEVWAFQSFIIKSGVPFGWPRLKEEVMDGWDCFFKKKKKRKKAACGQRTRENRRRRGIGQSCPIWRRERLRNQSEREEEETGQQGKEKRGKEGERETGDRLDPFRPARATRWFSTLFRPFFHPFPANWTTSPHGKHSRTFPLPIPSQIWRDLVLKLGKTHQRVWLLRVFNSPIF